VRESYAISCQRFLFSIGSRPHEPVATKKQQRRIFIAPGLLIVFSVFPTNRHVATARKPLARLPSIACCNRDYVALDRRRTRSDEPSRSLKIMSVGMLLTRHSALERHAGRYGPRFLTIFCPLLIATVFSQPFVPMQPGGDLPAASARNGRPTKGPTRTWPPLAFAKPRLVEIVVSNIQPPPMCFFFSLLLFGPPPRCMKVLNYRCVPPVSNRNGPRLPPGRDPEILAATMHAGRIKRKIAATGEKIATTRISTDGPHAPARCFPLDNQGTHLRSVNSPIAERCRSEPDCSTGASFPCSRVHVQCTRRVRKTSGGNRLPPISAHE